MFQINIQKLTINWDKFEKYILLALFFSIPIWPRATTLLIILYIILLLCTLKKRPGLVSFLNYKEFVGCALLYVLLIIGLSYTIDINTGISKIQTQASLLVVPLFLGSQNLTRSDRTAITDLFILGLLTTVLLCFCHAVYRFLSNGSAYVLDEYSRKKSIFLYTEFSEFLDLHPTYFSLYLGFAIFYLIYNFYTKSKYLFVPKTGLILLFFIALFLTSSKAGIFSSILLIVIFLIYQLIRKRKKVYMILLIAIFSGTMVMLAVNPVLYTRSFQSISSINEGYQENNAINESTGIRLGLWHLSTYVSKDAILMGYGTGSVQKILNERCLEFNSFSTCESLRNKNSHNQFLNFLVTNGIVFMAVFITILILMLLRGFRTRDGIYVFFILFMGINFFFESLLQREKGIVFFTLFAVMLTISHGPLQRVNEKGHP